eukprot:363577-Chlamydomonas_euryale.AAC.5
MKRASRPLLERGCSLLRQACHDDVLKAHRDDAIARRHHTHTHTHTHLGQTHVWRMLIHTPAGSTARMTSLGLKGTVRAA